ncbi:T9SS type A sorting domain-containing protein [Polaribacter batillariae]|uniref:T9SS type A sorting domain-containing protein n=1 Tax=Polaribacter batillariae TaxID=2808900 RepID=A0ABX7SY95_9FLAO|nr:zinc-dependent metalloprotease family protein [Polaribacter batillariae]QTD38689.1 T9SS type A sorting domain-containing protein [Polaribacter batillariae]
MKKISLILLFCFSSIAFLAQEEQWKKIPDSVGEISEKNVMVRNDMPKEYQLYSLKTESFNKKIKTVKSSKKETIEVPTRNGLKKFYIEETSNFNKELASKYSNIVSYSGVQVDNSSIKMKFSKGVDGYHFSIYEPGKNTFYVDSYTKDHKKLIAYNRKDLIKEAKDFTCQVKEFNKDVPSFQSKNANDGLLRTYRLALVCTGEYAQFHLNRLGISPAETEQAKKAAVLSAMNTTLTRVNGVFERDLSVRMEIVANNDAIIFLDADTDNLTNDSTNELIDESQAICDSEIGNGNYDIGHTFSTAAGGFAGAGVVCITGQKASGVTGIAQPFGDEFDIDFVAHEFGHQFGAHHTFNGTASSCSGNRNNPTAVEPGSGTTIMGYAGICAPQNIQNDSDDHFHSVSIDEMWNIITTTGNCAAQTPTGNTAPSANAGFDYSIPKSTPFVLKGTGTDVDAGTTLLYSWEQIDNDVGFSIPPSATSTGGAVFRSLPLSLSPNRYMPALPTVLSGSTQSTWEVVPSVARELNFSLVVRDQNSGGGSSARDDMKVTVTDAEAFTVSAPNTAVVWDTGSTQTITWNKGTTDVAPINCANVNIKLSIDGGVTFPITLKSNTPNDGSEEVTVPNNPTSLARIMVEAADNIFYNVNASNFTINSIIPTFLFTDESGGTQFVCNSGGNNAVYNLDLDFVNGFSENVTFTTIGQPSGANVSFSPASINSDGKVTMTVSNLNGKTAQPYTINVVASTNTVTQDLEVQLVVTKADFNAVTLETPSNGATEVPVSQELSWVLDQNAVTYDIEIATDSDFSNIVASANTPKNTFKPNNLISNTTYYWRVKPKNSCGEGAFSNAFSFKTELCLVCTSVASTEFDTSTTLVKFNTINNSTPVKTAGYSDFTAMATTVEVNSSYDLTVNTNTADDSEGEYTTQTLVWIDWNQNCDFTDPGEQYDLGTTTSSTNGETSLSPLSITVPSDANLGSTIMRVSTKYTGDGSPNSCEMGADGEVEDYTIIIDGVGSIPNDVFKEFNLYPNPSTGVVSLKFNIEDSNQVSVQLIDVRGRLIDQKNFNNITTNRFSEKLSFENVSKGLYLLKITNGSKYTTKKLILR